MLIGAARLNVELRPKVQECKDFEKYGATINTIVIQDGDTIITYRPQKL